MEEIVHVLKNNRGKQFTTMQYCIWAKMVAGDLLLMIHQTLQYFLGLVTVKQRKADEGMFAEALTHVANKISGALTTVLQAVLIQV